MVLLPLPGLSARISGVACHTGSVARVMLFPEMNAGGFTRFDGTVQFYSRVNALVSPDDVVLDFGAGRGEWLDDDCDYRRELRRFRGRVRRVIGADVDPVVSSNPALDEHVLIEHDGRLGLDDQSVDLIVADHTFEHVTDPTPVARELTRVLRPGGWLCARTPNRLGYVALAAQALPRQLHSSVIAHLQPGRSPRDIFPTAYRMNTQRRLRQYFPLGEYEHFSYLWGADAPRFESHPVVRRLVVGWETRAPEALRTVLMAFLQRRTDLASMP